MTENTILILILFFGSIGAVTVVCASNHINLAVGYLTLTASLSCIFLYLGNIYTALTLVLLHSVSVILIIAYGVFACGFKIRIDVEKNIVVTIIAFLASLMLFVMMTIILMRSSFTTMVVSGENSFGILLTAKYVVLFEIIAASIFTAVTGTVFMTGRRK